MARSAVKSTKLQRAYIRCTIPTERILWNEAGNPLERTLQWNKSDQHPSYKRRLGGAAFWNGPTVISGNERKIYHLVTNDCGNVRCMENEQLECNKLVCSDCKWESYLFVEICILCKHSTTTICMNHFNNASKINNIAGHSGTILCQSSEHQVQTNYAVSKEDIVWRVRQS